MKPVTIPEIDQKIAKYPRVELIHLPTPLRKLANITADLGGPEIYVKRDDLTGMAFGGNKSRKLEFIVPDMLAKKADVVVTWAGLQSNWAMLTASAAVRFGIRPILVLFKTYDLPAEKDGNILLDTILGADVRIRDAAKGKLVGLENALAAVEEVAEEERRKGHRPYVVSVGGSMPLGSMDLPLGAIGYVNAYREMLEQTQALGFAPDVVVHSTGSGATQAGLVLGAKALTPKSRVVGISVSDPKDSFGREVLTIAEATERALDLATDVRAADILVHDEFIRDGYGVVNKDVAEVIRMVFTREGIVLDPVYTSKAFIGLLDLIRRGDIPRTAKVVFFHTGGTPALFPNKYKLVEFLK
jgi:D-cysteine desulfhydrase family pyridoxal phosphate-dependent enzyme